MSSAGGWSRTAPFFLLFISSFLLWCRWPWMWSIFSRWTWMPSSFFMLLLPLFMRFRITIRIRIRLSRLRIVIFRLRMTWTSSSPSTWRVMPLISPRTWTNFHMLGYIRWMWPISMNFTSWVFLINSPWRYRFATSPVWIRGLRPFSSRWTVFGLVIVWICFVRYSWWWWRWISRLPFRWGGLIPNCWRTLFTLFFFLKSIILRSIWKSVLFHFKTWIQM